LLLARDSSGELGWLLASILFPVGLLARRPSTESLYSIRSAGSSSGHSHYVDAPEFTSSPPRHMPMSLHSRMASYSIRMGARAGRGIESLRRNRAHAAVASTRHPSLQRRNLGARPAEPHRHPSPHPPDRQYTHPHDPHPHPPMPPMSQLTVSSRWYRAPTLYTCRVVHEYEPPEGVEYLGLPFFKLFLDDVYHVLREAGPPSRHRDLPVLVDEREDCLRASCSLWTDNGHLIYIFGGFFSPPILFSMSFLLV
jgi:dynamin-binding protein